MGLQADSALGLSCQPRYHAGMLALRTRKLIGVFLTVIFLAVYALVVMAFGGVFVLGKGPVVELAFYVIAGFAWLPGEMAIVRWMSKPDTAA
jgi:hypothetical protein